MKNLTNITPHIHRLVIPFLDIYTTVFIIETPTGAVLFDTATYPEDADNYIIPALTTLGVTAQSLKYIVLSHSHRDHAGGLGRLMQIFPNACIVSRHPPLLAQYPRFSVLLPEDNASILDTLQIIAVPGHSPDSLSLLDTRSKTLLTGDCLQLFGIYGSGAWGSSIRLPVEHLEALDKLRALDIETIIASHDYHPHGYIARGKGALIPYLDTCAQAIYQIRDTLLLHPSLDDSTLAEIYNQTSTLPTVASGVFTAVRAAIKAKML